MAKRLRGRYGYPSDDPFKVTFHPQRLREPSKIKKPSKIFTCSMGELFDQDSTYTWIGLIFAEMERCPQHTFQILTKCPDVLHQFDFPTNAWIGASVDMEPRLKYALEGLHSIEQDNVKFISFEPLIESMWYPDLKGIDWVIIGAMTGPQGFIPEREWVQEIIDSAREGGCAVFLKNNLKWHEKIQEYPRSVYSSKRK